MHARILLLVEYNNADLPQIESCSALLSKSTK
jgi:hypothetical protein